MNMSLMRRLNEWKRWAGTYYWDMYCKDQFLRACPTGARVLDVGCGNDSPAHFKEIRPDFYYVGLDIADYNQISDPRGNADEYLLTTPEQFNVRIAELPATFDAVISSHNLEHCNAPDQTLTAMLGVIKPGGRVFLAFPSEASLHFPKRKGTLNFYDDPSHLNLPNFAAVGAALADHGFRIDVVKRRYRPLVRALKGLIKEPRHRLQRTVDIDIWALYGFETIIWATRTGLS